VASPDIHAAPAGSAMQFLCIQERIFCVESSLLMTWKVLDAALTLTRLNSDCNGYVSANPNILTKGISYGRVDHHRPYAGSTGMKIGPYANGTPRSGFAVHPGRPDIRRERPATALPPLYGRPVLVQARRGCAG
jgi:hypothetical protein